MSEWYILKSYPNYLNNYNNLCRRNKPIWQVFNPSSEEGFVYSGLSIHAAVKFCKEHKVSYKFVTESSSVNPI